MPTVFSLLSSPFFKIRDHYRNKQKRFYLQFNNSTSIHTYINSVHGGKDVISRSKFLRKNCAVYSIDGNGDVILEYADKHNTAVKKAIRKFLKSS